MGTVGPGTGDIIENHGVNDDDQQGLESNGPPEVTFRGLITPRGQIRLIALAIVLFNIVLIGLLVWLIFTH